MEEERVALRGEKNQLRTSMGTEEIIQNLDGLWAVGESVANSLENIYEILTILAEGMAEVRERVNRINEREGLSFQRLPRKPIDLESILLSPTDSPSSDPTS